MKLPFKWHNYHYRVIGMAMAGAGSGLILDELMNGPFHLGLGDHETWGLVGIVIGLILIARYPKGKDLPKK